ncbi:MAG: RNA polymerase sigma factor [Blastocatellia bacterium]
MKKDRQFSEEDFQRFLNWLDPDPEKAAQTYEKMRCHLIKLLDKRGCRFSEDLADESFDRVILRLPNMPDPSKVVPAAYLVAVAKNRYLEYVEEMSKMDHLPDSDHADFLSPASGQGAERDEALDCLERCLAELSPESRQLILEYYRENKRAKIDNRQKIAEDLGLTFNALRIRAHRIRDALRKWLDECLKGESHH